jgi:outer membrane receptor protein involved in Fe transport
MNFYLSFETLGGTSNSLRKSRLLTGAAFAIGALPLLCSPALAQEAAVDEGESAQIVVTGSRIVRDGIDAPTPVSVIGTEEIANEAPANIADFVNTLPSVGGSQTAVSNSGSLSNGQSGISALNLRSLGQNRTLVLLDGQRSVGSTSTGLVDINTFPQALIERVEVVTGGASSVYGSDAVAGVVNFILNKSFSGIKADYEYGVTTYSDVPNHKVQLTAGTGFADGRGHFEISGEYFTQHGKDTIDRKWNNSGFFQINNPNYTSTNGQPSRLIVSGAGPSYLSPGGLISSGPFRGTYFGTINPGTGLASVGQLNFGNVSGPWMTGGDYLYTRDGHVSSNSLANDEERISVFARASFEITDNIEVFAQASYNRFEGESFYQQTPTSATTIQLDNAFLPDSFRQMVLDYNAANGTNIRSISIGTSNAGIPAAGSHNVREVQRYVVGANGQFTLAGLDVNWDTYFQHGKADTNEELINTWQNSRINAMQDAVYDGGGNIVCRVNIDASSANDLPGCIPLNRIGVGGVTQEALDYLFQVYPSRKQYIKQDVFALNFSTKNLFSTWAGPVSLAIGGEYREDSVDGYIDPVNLSTFLYGNFRVTTGKVNVKEFYAETLVPLGFGLDFNGALRVTDYSISGSVTTWKLGATWQPIPDVKLRGTVSRDIRAPNLNELFDAGTARTNSVIVPGAGGGRSDQFIQNLTGSTDLKPEVANTYGIGVVFTPEFMPGFAFSADYFNIEIEDAINSVSAQTTVNLCFEQNIQSFCENVRYAAGSSTDIEFIDLKPFNFASQRASGIDFEASYRREIGAGRMTLRGLATYYIENVSDNGIDAPDDIAGVNAVGGIPSLTYRVSAGYDFDSGFGAYFVGRGFSNGVYDNDYIECKSGCPASDPVNRTINNNHIKGTLYIDANFNYAFNAGPTKAEAFFAVKNLFDRDPVLVGNGPDGNNTPAYPQTNRSLYDTFGRVFRVGLRVKY